MDQQDKKVCFTSIGWYKLEGFVHGTGTTTSDYEDLFVDEVCVVSGIECTLTIWNGTGPLDTGGDWGRGGEGFEAAYAKHDGTNGLDVSNFTKNKTIEFTRGPDIDIGEYDLLAMWVNVKNWTVGEHVEVQFHGQGWLGNSVNLDAYINKSIVDIWQRALIPFVDLGLTTSSIYVNKLRLKSTGNIGIYLDDVEVVVGTVSYVAIPICDPDMDAYEYGLKHLKGEELRSGIKIEEDIRPDIDSKLEDLKPDMSGKEIGPPKLRAFPEPNNL